jgi:hypothetical protein
MKTNYAIMYNAVAARKASLSSRYTCMLAVFVAATVAISIALSVTYGTGNISAKQTIISHASVSKT